MLKSFTKRYAFSNLVSIKQKHLYNQTKVKDFFDNIEIIIFDIKYNANAPNDQLEIERRINKKLKEKSILFS